MRGVRRHRRSRAPRALQVPPTRLHPGRPARPGGGRTPAPGRRRMTMAARTPDPNYRWWTDHGQAWPGEVERRKGYMPIYSIQEVLLAEYLSRNAPASVLEFGCGFGRHLAYLSRVPGLT